MTKDEAEKLCLLLAEVDGACPVCIDSAIEDANRLFPEWVWAQKDNWDYKGCRVKVRARNPARTTHT